MTAYQSLSTLLSRANVMCQRYSPIARGAVGRLTIRIRVMHTSVFFIYSVWHQEDMHLGGDQYDNQHMSREEARPITKESSRLSNLLRRPLY